MPFDVLESITLAVASERLRTPAGQAISSQLVMRLRWRHGTSPLVPALVLESGTDGEPQ